MALAVATTVSCTPHAEAAMKLGLLTAMNGGAALNGGESNIEAFKMAIDDFGGQLLGEPIQTVVADHKSKPDFGLATARE
jgi:branched-chain amino acid transport system substrate-binding protein